MSKLRRLVVEERKCFYANVVFSEDEGWFFPYDLIVLALSNRKSDTVKARKEYIDWNYRKSSKSLKEIKENIKTVRIELKLVQYP